MELEIEPYVLEGSCCVSHQVPFLIYYLCNAYFFFLFPPAFFFLVYLIPLPERASSFYFLCCSDFDALNKDETLDQRNVFASLTACFIKLSFHNYSVILFQDTNLLLLLQALEDMSGRAQSKLISYHKDILEIGAA